MAQKLTAALPPDLDLPANFIVRVSALDPTTGALVSGVNVSNVAIVADSLTPDTADTATALVPVAPLWLPDEVAPPASGGG
jgi:hypothetical protein